MFRKKSNICCVVSLSIHDVNSAVSKFPCIATCEIFFNHAVEYLIMVIKARDKNFSAGNSYMHTCRLIYMYT